MNPRESTLAAVQRYRMTAGRWPSRTQLGAALAERKAAVIDQRLDALERQGLIQRKGGRIVAATGVAETETMK